jgi:uncharacterized membrane protein YphA (DoxX/SURF4 family)
MTVEPQRSPSKVVIGIGWLLSILPSLLLLFAGSMKLMGGNDADKMFEHLGYHKELALVIGIVEIVCTLIYLLPRTAVLGAILLTGYLGGAVATHDRVSEWQFFAPLVLGIVIWLGFICATPACGRLSLFEISIAGKINEPGIS